MFHHLWDYGFKPRIFLNDDSKDSMIPKFFPFHTKYKQNGSIGHLETLLKEMCVKCETKNSCFHNRDELKGHCLKMNNWYHKWLYFMIKILYEDEPDPIGTKTYDHEFQANQNSSETKKMNIMSVKRCVKK